MVNDPIPRAKVGLGRQTQSTEHHEYLPYERMGEFWKVLKANESNVTRILELIVLTAARSGEARGARWGEVDLGNATWTIPAVRMKKGREHRVPLSLAAIDVLRRARAAQPPTMWWGLVFPNGARREMAKEAPAAVHPPALSEDRGPRIPGRPSTCGRRSRLNTPRSSSITPWPT